jgi:hypothetical protein
MRYRRWVGLLLAAALVVPVGSARAATRAPTPTLIPVVAMATPKIVTPDDLADQAQNGPTGIGPGSQLFISFGGSGGFGCTANFVWTDGAKSYLGTAGHCVVPFSNDATDGTGALFDRSIVHVSVCVASCFTDAAEYVALGPLAYGRRRTNGAEQGHDFGLVEIPSALAGRIRPSMPVWGGPTTESALPGAARSCMYGNGGYFNRSAPSRIRTGALVNHGSATFTAAMPAASGDSGSGVVLCAPDAGNVVGGAALGILTHILGVTEVRPIVGPVSIGTTVAAAEALATEAGLHIHVVTEGAAGEPVAIPPVPLAGPRVVSPTEITDGPANIGPGTLLAIRFGAYTVGCTANFVWSDGATSYLGTAGHCVIPGSKDATHGTGALFDASGISAYACVAQCLTADRQFVALGPIAYGRRRDGINEQGHDFGLITIPSSLASMIRPAMPVWSGPTTESADLLAGPACFYGNGAFFNRTPVTRIRTGALISSGSATWTAALGAASGDSGSGVVLCAPGTGGLQGTVALGILTHGVGVPFTSPGVGPVAFGTTVPQAEAMATEAGLHIHVVTVG